MANELVHVTVGTELTQAEYEGITAHQFNAQATGDILYASSATQLSRLADVAVGQVLVSGGVGAAPAWSATPTVNGLAFPATQAASADANTLDDYEEGTWTPVITFATPGDLSVVYGAARLGRYLKWGRSVWLTFVIHASTFTHTTASGALRITGIPFTSVNLDYYESLGSCGFWGITKANFTNFTPSVGQNLAYLTILASGSGQTWSSVAAADMPTGAAKYLYGTIFYEV